MKKIKIDRPELSDADILKHKDFKHLSQTVINTPTNTWSNLKYWAYSGGATVMLAAVIALVVNLQETPEELAPLVQEEQISVINPPFPDEDVPYESFVIDNTRDTNIHFSTGTIIHIPKDAFDCDNPENIEIKYREFHNPMDIFLSGIPMEYDSAGVEYNFESAGMLDIRAFNKGKALKLKKGRELDVQMASLDLDLDFNLYSLDGTTGVWDYKGKDKIVPVSKPSQVMHETPETLLSEWEVEDNYSTISRAPVKRNEKRYAFKLDLNDDEKQQFANSEDVLFEIRPSEVKDVFDPKFYDVEWESMNLSSRPDGDYDLSLKRNSIALDLLVYPVYSEAKYQLAKDKYEEELKANEAQKKAILSQRKAAVSKNNDIDKMYDDYLKSSLNTKGFREFSISQMGIHNMDLPILPAGKVISLSMINQDEKHLDYKVIYVVEKGKNMITKYTDDIPSIMVNTEKENVVWALTDENKIAIPKQEQVNAITKKSEINQQFDAKDYKTKEGLQELKKSMDLPVTDKKEKIKLSSKIYPNPCVNHVNIELNESHDCLVQLLDQTGRMVDNVSFTGENYRWNIDKHKEGNYILVVLIPSLQYKSSFKVLKK